MTSVRAERSTVEATPADRFQVVAVRKTAEFVGRPHFVEHPPDGSFDIPSLPVSVAGLRRYAERYGTDGVLEAAAGVLDERLVVRLRVELDAIDRGRAPRFGKVRARRRSTVETRADGVGAGCDRGQAGWFRMRRSAGV